MATPNPQALAGMLRNLADKIEDENVKLTFSHLKITAEDVREEMPDFSVKHYDTGERTWELTITYQDPELDRRSNYIKDMKEYDS